LRVVRHADIRDELVRVDGGGHADEEHEFG
jgi:hypothetical protein